MSARNSASSDQQTRAARADFAEALRVLDRAPDVLPDGDDELAPGRTGRVPNG